jgi:hypothetical protein
VPEQIGIIDIVEKKLLGTAPTTPVGGLEAIASLSVISA